MSATSLSSTQFVEISRDKYCMHTLKVQNREEAMAELVPWAAHVAQGLKSHVRSPDVMTVCIECMNAFFSVTSHYVDDRELIAMMSKHLRSILNVFAHYTTHEDMKLRHTMCRRIVCILIWMAGRMDDFNNEFAMEPSTVRPDEKKRFKELDWTEVNEAQFQPSPRIRIFAAMVIDDYLVRFKADREQFPVVQGNPYDDDFDDDYGDQLQDVENLRKWIHDGGMFMSRVVKELGPDPCECPDCSKKCDLRSS